ncbi:MAG: hypothetical protein HUK24_00390 [Sphaerochaetaceae bacterium]|nr:hypothetical protein [Sphaerochaetaceae bacterium]
MIVQIEDFNAYSGNWEDKDEAVKLKTRFLQSAEEIVEGYLGYNIEQGPELGMWNDGERPSVVPLSIMRIATLMLCETNGNIGVTSKSFADNSRTFISYANYRKYLQPLDPYRKARF